MVCGAAAVRSAVTGVGPAAGLVFALDVGDGGGARGGGDGAVGRLALAGRALSLDGARPRVLSCGMGSGAAAAFAAVGTGIDLDPKRAGLGPGFLVDGGVLVLWRGGELGGDAGLRRPRAGGGVVSASGVDGGERGRAGTGARGGVRRHLRGLAGAVRCGL